MEVNYRNQRSYKVNIESFKRNRCNYSKAFFARLKIITYFRRKKKYN